jgi:hypothetical protein
MMSHRILPAALLLCTLTAACGELPTGNETHAQPDGPAYDGGFGVGSGNSATQSSGYTIGSGGGVATDGGSAATSGSTGSTEDTGSGDAERGGYTIGSGG